ncbi:type II toxin-antitoxin system RelE/ParE family toxin [Chlorobium sp. BLA1]|uniref:type II toxin-antitoxin system RelE family toxin n=1 Tax=Candidatus Chlorobium masyuteum TaxID=2716876 RepID=UPI0014212F63|nr:type II toxin-antitoxin system RelE/ParE family toxin [Candidatus Chlorobium masyuteum]NHQ59998.1 type II toxin-antitoxin system RelE/ParE family toxin [Candidatus Chlorobium masyuteum]
MGSYSIHWKNSAVKELKKLANEIIPEIVNTVNDLAVDPLPPGCKKMRGSVQTYRIRKGDYRIIYSIEHEQLVIHVIRVGHRKDIYEKFNP